jgi:acyl dehydratase
LNAPARIGQVLPTTALPPISQADVDAYLLASGDDNPLHSDPAVAARAGLGGVVVPGMLVMGRLAHWVSLWSHCHVVTDLTARFIAPVIVGDEIAITGRVVAIDSAGSAVVRISAAQGMKFMVIAEAQVVVRAQ